MKVFREELNRVLVRFDSNQSKKFSLEGCTLFEESDYFKIFGFGTTSLPADWAGYKWSEISKGPRKGQVVKRKKTDRDIKKQKQEERFKGVSREERQRILIQEAKDRAKNR